MPVLFAFPRSTRSNRGRTVPLHSAMRKSGGGTKSIRRRIKTVHFASTKTLLSAPRPPPSLPLIPYDSNTNTNNNTSAYDPRSTSYSNTTQSASSRIMPGSSTPSSQAQMLSPDLIAYYQPSKPPAQVVQAETVPLDVEWDWEPEPEAGRQRSGRQKTPREKLPKTPHPRKAIDLPAASPSIREKMGLGAGGGGGDSYFPSVAGYTPSQSQSHSGHDAGHDERGRRRRDSSVSGMFDRLRGRSRSHSQSQSRHPAIAPSAAPAPPTHDHSQGHAQGYAYAQNGVGGGGGGGGGGAYLQVPGRQRHGSFNSSASASGSGSGSAFSSGSGSAAVPILMQTGAMSSSAPSISHLHAQMNARNRRPSTSTGVHGVGYGNGYGNCSNGSLQPHQQHQQPFYPPTSSPSAAGHAHSHSGGTRSRTSSFNTYPSSHSHSHQHQHPHPHAHTQPQPHAPHLHQQQQQSRHHHSASATTYPNPPPTVRRRSYSNPPETRRPVPTQTQPHGQGHAQTQGVYTPQQPLHPLAPPPQPQPHVSHSHSTSSASPYLNLPTRDVEYTRRRAGSFSYGAPIQREREREGLHPSPQSHLHIPARDRRHGGGGVSADNSPNAAPQVYSQQTQPQPQMLRRRTYSNPHLPSATAGARYHSTLQQQQQPVYSNPHSRVHPRSGTTVAPHRYLAVLPPSSSHSHSQSNSQKVQISWDMRFPPSTATRSRLSRGATKTKVHYLSPQALAEPATNPACGFMRVSCTRLVVQDIGGGGGSGQLKLTGGGAREGWPWPIAIYPQSHALDSTVGGGGGVITLHDVLQQIYASLRTRASEKEYERLLPDRADKRAVSSAYEARWREETRVGDARDARDTRDVRDAAGERNAGLRRVDFLRGRTRLVGLEPVGGVEGEWCLVVS